MTEIDAERENGLCHLKDKGGVNASCLFQLLMGDNRRLSSRRPSLRQKTVLKTPLLLFARLTTPISGASDAQNEFYAGMLSSPVQGWRRRGDGGSQRKTHHVWG